MHDAADSLVPHSYLAGWFCLRNRLAEAAAQLVLSASSSGSSSSSSSSRRRRHNWLMQQTAWGPVAILLGFCSKNWRGGAVQQSLQLCALCKQQQHV
jgi:hypothetical protein